MKEARQREYDTLTVKSMQNLNRLNSECRTIDQSISKLINMTNRSQIDEHYMLFLFKSYEYDAGIVECCKKHVSLTTELVNYHIREKH